MRQWVVLSLLLAAPHGTFAAEGKVASARELLRMGFFQDFEEIDLLEILESAEIPVRVAGGRGTSADTAAGVVSVLNDEEMRLRGIRTLQQALELIPGVDVTTDGLGRPRIVLRGVHSGATGGGSEEMLLLINGHRMDDPFLGGATLLNPSLPVANVKRIEVLRGAASALYGSGAVAGVVDVLTYGPEDFSGIEGSVEAGSFATQRYALRLGSRAGEFRTFGFLQFEDTNGARLTVPADSQTGRGPSLAPRQSRDDLQAIETNYRIDWRSFTMNLRVGNARGDGFVGLSDALGDNDLSYRQIASDVAYQRTTTRSGVFRAQLSFAQNRYRQFQQPLPPGFSLQPDDASQPTVVFPQGVLVEQNADSRRFGVLGTWERELGAHALLAGLGLGRESAQDVEVISNYDFATGDIADHETPLPGAGGDDGRALFAVFVHDEWTPSQRASVTAALRFDQVGDVSNVSPRIGAVYKLSSDVRFKLTYGRAFRAPTLAERELSVPLLLERSGLDPVRIDTLEAAVALKRNALRGSATAYLSYLRDAVEPIGAFDPARSRPSRNGPGADLRGLELELRRIFGRADSVFASVTVQDVEDRRTGRDAPFIPTLLGSLGGTVFLAGDRLSVTPVWRFRSSREREARDARPPLAGQGLLDLTLRAPNVYKGLSLTLSGRNLLDQPYHEPAVLGGVPGDYPRPGRSVLLQASYLF